MTAVPDTESVDGLPPSAYPDGRAEATLRLRALRLWSARCMKARHQ